ncbi:MAG: HU family DNA-binding protein [Candidatus Glassbacteria bacterium]
MTKADIVERISATTGLTKKDTAMVINRFFEVVTEALSQGNNIEIRGFGSFKVKTRRARKARNPRTGETVDVPRRLVPTFKPSKELKDIIAKKTESSF